MPNHCVATYNHIESPVWCLATNSPTLGTFWAGTKDGWVYKFSGTAQTDHDDRNIDCVALCKEPHPILSVRSGLLCFNFFRLLPLKTIMYGLQLPHLLFIDGQIFLSIHALTHLTFKFQHLAYVAENQLMSQKQNLFLLDQFQCIRV